MYDVREGQAGWDQRRAFHERLDQIIKTAIRDSYNNDYEGWSKCLLFLKISLHAHMTEEQKRNANSLLKKCNMMINNRGSRKINIEPFVELQEHLNQVMRDKGFDVPIGEEDGSL